jgi:selenide,water dikinase
VLWSDQVPALPGALELAAHGVESTLAPENRRLLLEGGFDSRAALLVDPQTSGGLLAGIAPDLAMTCVERLQAAGMQAAIIGVVEAGEPIIRLAPS